MICALGSRAGLKAAACLGAALILSGCEDGQGFDFLKPKAEAESAPAAPTATQNAEGALVRDVEAPDVFSINEPALWDGRPSLGGVWVAYPGVKDPERVIIRNTENNQSVVGALFRRERENPGPRVQVSSDAAQALGMLAGAPTKLSIVALRKEEIPQAAPAPVAEEAVPGAAEEDVAAASVESLPEITETQSAAVDAPEIQASTLDPVAVAGAAIDNAAAEAEAPATQTETTAAATPEPAAPRPPLIALTKPFIQVGTFSVKSNAEDTAETLRKNGILPFVREDGTAEKPLFRVVVGPATNRTERRDLLKRVKDLGFTDSFNVAN